MRNGPFKRNKSTAPPEFLYLQRAPISSKWWTSVLGAEFAIHILFPTLPAPQNVLQVIQSTILLKNCT